MFTVYRIYDALGDLLYVGCTSDVDRRLRTHARKQWGRRIDEVRTETYDDHVKALAAEAYAIATEHPEFNVSYNRTRSKMGTRRAQVLGALAACGPMTTAGVQNFLADDLISSYVGVTIKRLVDEGLVEVVAEFPSASRWRRANVYGLTAKVLERHNIPEGVAV